MSETGASTLHASAVLIGERAVLIRGPSGSGKTRLAFELILAGRCGQIAPATLVGDDRVHVEPRAGVLLVRPAPALAGLIEIRGLGIRRCAYAPEATIGLLVDLEATDAERLPPSEALMIHLSGIKIPRIPVKQGYSGLPLVIAALTMTANSPSADQHSDCSKEFGNHITPTIGID